jgi:hypothetical protein
LEDNGPEPSTAFSTIDRDAPVHQRTGASCLKPANTSWSDIFQAHNIPQEVKDKFCVGWNQKKWYVVGKGKDYGIFYDFWYYSLPFNLLMILTFRLGETSSLFVEYSGHSHQNTLAQPPGIL